MDDQIRAAIEREVDHLREVVDVRLNAMDKALELQATEYERRLDALNHEYTRNQEMLSKTVDSNVYAADKRTATSDLGSVRDQVLAEAASRAARWQVGTVVFVIVGWVVAWFLS